MYGLNANVLQAKFDAVTGAITAGGGNTTLDSNGLTLIPILTYSVNRAVSWASGGTKAADIYDNFNSPGGSSVLNITSYQNPSITAGYGQMVISAQNDASNNVVLNFTATGTTYAGSEGANKTWLRLYGSSFLGFLISAAGTGVPNAMLDVRGDIQGASVQWVTGTQPTCNAGNRGKVWYVAGAGGVKDTFNVCTKDAADAYAWRVIY
jgi:hypothetical protein